MGNWAWRWFIPLWGLLEVKVTVIFHVLQNELIIQCQQFTRWLHAACDFIRNEREAKFCAKDGYTCVLCRSPDQQPPHLHPSNASVDALTLAPPPLVSVLAASNQAGNRQNRQSSSATPPPSPVPGLLQKLAGGPLINGSSNSIRPKSPASFSSQFLVDGASLSEGGITFAIATTGPAPSPVSQ
jgi:hypothetical protein